MYAKLNAYHYDPTITIQEAQILPWRTRTLINLEPRRVGKHPHLAETIAPTDAAKSTMIIAAVVINRQDYSRSPCFSSPRAIRVGSYWHPLCDKTCLIYVLEVLALLALVATDDTDLLNNAVIYHLDRNNAHEALAKKDARPIVITAMAHLIWHRLRLRGITPWFERVPSNGDPSDLPTRRVNPPTSAFPKDIRLFEGRLSAY